MTINFPVMICAAYKEYLHVACYAHLLDREVLLHAVYLSTMQYTTNAIREKKQRIDKL